MIKKLKYKKFWRKTSLKQKDIGVFFLDHVLKKKPKNFLEVGIFHGVTARNVCDLLSDMHGHDFKFIGIDLFLSEKEIANDEYIPKTKFSNPLKSFYYKYIIRLDPYTIESVERLLKKYKKNINIIKGDSNKVLKEIFLDSIDYVFLDGGHKYETIKQDLDNLTHIIDRNGLILCDDYNLSYAPGVKKAIDEYVLNKNFNLNILNTRFAEITKKNK